MRQGVYGYLLRAWMIPKNSIDRFYLFRIILLAAEWIFEKWRANDLKMTENK